MTLSEDITTRDLHAQVHDLIAHNDAALKQIDMLRRHISVSDGLVKLQAEEIERLRKIVDAHEGVGRAAV